MASLNAGNVSLDESLEDFEFFDAAGELEVDLSKSPVHEAAEKLSSGMSLVLSALSTVAEEQGMQVTVPVQAVAATAVGAITGSLLGGPSGLAIGLLTGAVIAYRTSPRRSKSPKAEPAKVTISQVFSQMTVQQKMELLKELLGCLKQSNVRMLIAEILKNAKIRNMALSILSNFLMKRMGLCLSRPK